MFSSHRSEKEALHNKRLESGPQANVIVHSSDESLSPEKPPETIHQCREKSLLWRLLLSPFRSTKRILQEQQVIDQFIGLDERGLREHLIAKNRAYLLPDSIKAIFRYTRYEGHSSGRVIDLARSGVLQARNDVAHAVAHMEEGLAALKRLGFLIRAGQGTFLQRFKSSIADLQKCAPFLTEEYLLGKNFKPDVVQGIESASMNVVTQMGVSLEFTVLAKEFKFARVTLDESTPVSYTEGFNITCMPSLAHKNRSTDDCSTIAFAGTNMSGKSETGLKQDFLIHSIGLRFGYTSAQNVNLHVVDSHVYVDRVGSITAQGLSSFGTDITYLAEVLPQSTGRSRWYFDEFGSTTGPREQATLLMTIALWSKERNDSAQKRVQRTRVASHSEEFLAGIVRLPDSAIYHFKVTIGSEQGMPEITCHYELAEGIDDAHSIKIARSLKFRPEILADVEKAMAGKFLGHQPMTQALPAAQPSKPRALFFTPRIAQGYGAVAKEIDQLMGAWAASVTRDFNGTIYIHGHHDTDRLSFGAHPRVVHRELFGSPFTSAEETRENHTLYQTLIERSPADRLVAIAGRMHFYERLRSAHHLIGGELARFTRGIAKERDSSRETVQENAALLTARVRLLRKHLGDCLLPYERLAEKMEQLTTLSTAAVNGKTLQSIFDHQERTVWTVAVAPEIKSAAELFTRKHELSITITTQGDLRELKRQIEHQSKNRKQRIARQRDLYENFQPLNEAMDALPRTRLSIPEICHPFRSMTLAQVRPLIIDIDLEAEDCPLTEQQYFALHKAYNSALELAYEHPIADGASLALIEQIKRDPLVAPHVNDATFTQHNNIPHLANLVANTISNVLYYVPQIPYGVLSPSAIADEMKHVAHSRIHFNGHKQRNNNEIRKFEEDLNLATREILNAVFNITPPLAEFKQELARYTHPRLQSITQSIAAAPDSSHYDDTLLARGLLQADCMHCAESFKPLLTPCIELQIQYFTLMVEHHWLRSAIENCGRDRKKPAMLSRMELEGAIILLREKEKTIPENIAPVLDAYFTLESRAELLITQVIAALPKVKKPAFSTYGGSEHTTYASRLSTVFENACDLAITYPCLNGRANSHFYWHEDRRSVQVTAVEEVCSLAAIAEHFRKNNFCNTLIATDGCYRVNGLWNMLFPKKSSTPQSVILTPDKRLLLLAGVNMSGKSYLGQSLLVGGICALRTGFAPAAECSIPPYELMVWIERIAGKEDRTLSAAGHEFVQWNMIYEALNGVKQAFFFVDEGFSSLPPRYQAAFAEVQADVLVRRGLHGAWAMHHPEALDRIEKRTPGTEINHLSYRLTPDKKIEFGRQLIKGGAPSEAIAVARMLGLDEPFVRRWETLLNNTHLIS